MGKFRQFLTELSAHDIWYFRQDNNLSRFQRIFTKLDICIDIVEIWFGTAIGYISSIFTELSSHDNNVGASLFQVLTSYVVGTY